MVNHDCQLNWIWSKVKDRHASEWVCEGIFLEELAERSFLCPDMRGKLFDSPCYPLIFASACIYPVAVCCHLLLTNKLSLFSLPCGLKTSDSPGTL